MVRERRYKSKSEVDSNEYLNSTSGAESAEATNKSTSYEAKHSNIGTHCSATYQQDGNSTKLVASTSSPNLNATFIISAGDNTSKPIATISQSSNSHISTTMAPCLPGVSINPSLHGTIAGSKNVWRFFPSPPLDCLSRLSSTNHEVHEDSKDMTSVSNCNDESPEAKTPYSETNSQPASLEETNSLETTDPSSQGYNSAERSTTMTFSADRSLDRDSSFSRSIPSQTRSLTSTPSSGYQPSYLEPVSMHYLSRTMLRSRYGSAIRRLTYT